MSDYSQVSAVQQCVAYKKGKRFGRWHKREFILTSNGMLVNRKLGSKKPNLILLTGVNQRARASALQSQGKKLPKKLQKQLRKLDACQITRQTVVSRNVEVQEDKKIQFTFQVYNIKQQADRIIGFKIRGQAEVLLRAIQRFSDPGLVEELNQGKGVNSKHKNGNIVDNSQSADLAESTEVKVQMEGLIPPQPLTGEEWQLVLERAYQTHSISHLQTVPMRRWSQDFYLANHHNVADMHSSSAVLLDRALTSFQLWKHFTVFTSTILQKYIASREALLSREDALEVKSLSSSCMDFILVSDVAFCFVPSESLVVPGPKGPSTSPALLEGLMGMFRGNQAYQICCDYVSRANYVAPGGEHVPPPPAFFRDLNTGRAAKSSDLVHPILDPKPPLVAVARSGALTAIAFHSPRWLQSSLVGPVGLHRRPSSRLRGSPPAKLRVSQTLKAPEPDHWSVRPPVQAAGAEAPAFPALPQALRLSIAKWSDSSHAPLVVPVMHKASTRACKALLVRPDQEGASFSEPAARLRSTTETAREARESRRSRNAQPIGAGAAQGEASASGTRRPLVLQSFQRQTTLDIDISVQENDMWIMQVLGALGLASREELCGIQDEATGLLFYYGLNRTNQLYNDRGSHLAGYSLYGPVLVVWPLFPFPFLPPEVALRFPEVVESYSRSMLERQGRGIGHLRQARAVSVEQETVTLRRAVADLLCLSTANLHVDASLARATLVQHTPQLTALLEYLALAPHQLQALGGRLALADQKLKQAGGLPSARQDGQRVGQMLAVEAIADAAATVLSLRVARARVGAGGEESWEEDESTNPSGANKPSWGSNERNVSSGKEERKKTEGSVIPEVDVIVSVHVQFLNELFAQSEFLNNRLWRSEVPAMLALSNTSPQVSVLPRWLCTSSSQENITITSKEFETFFEAFLEKLEFSPNTKFLTRVARFFATIPEESTVEGFPFKINSDDIVPVQTECINLGTNESVKSAPRQMMGESFHTRRLLRLAQQYHIEHSCCSSDAPQVFSERKILKQTKDPKIVQVGYVDPSLRYARALSNGVQQDWHPECPNEGIRDSFDSIPWCDSDERATARISIYALLVDTVFHHLDSDSLEAMEAESRSSTVTKKNRRRSGSFSNNVSTRQRNQSLFDPSWSSTLFWSNSLAPFGNDRSSNTSWITNVFNKIVHQQHMGTPNQGLENLTSPASAVAAVAKSHSLKQLDLLKHLQVRSVVSWIRVAFWHAISSIAKNDENAPTHTSAYHRSMDCVDRALQILSGSCSGVNRTKTLNRCFPGEVVLLCQGLRSTLALSLAVESLDAKVKASAGVSQSASEALGAAGEVVAFVASCLDIHRQLSSDTRDPAGEKGFSSTLSPPDEGALRRHMLVLAVSLLQWLQRVAPRLHRHEGAALGNALTKRTHNEVLFHGSLSSSGTSEHLCLDRLSRLVRAAKARLAHEAGSDSVPAMGCAVEDQGARGLGHLLLGCGECALCRSRGSRLEPMGPLSGLVAFVGNVEAGSPYGFRSASVLRARVLERDRFLLSDLEAKYFLSPEPAPKSPLREPLRPESLVRSARALPLDKGRTTTTVYAWGSLAGVSLDQEQQVRDGLRLPSGGDSPDEDLRATKLDQFPHRGVRVSSVSCGHRHSALVTEGGLMLTMGHGETGRLGHGNEVSVMVPKVVESLVAANVFVTSAACGREHTVALGEMSLPVTQQGTSEVGSAARKVVGLAFSWGWGEAGRLGVGDMGVQPYPILVESLAFVQGNQQQAGHSTAGSVKLRLHSERQVRPSFTPKSSFSLGGASWQGRARRGWEGGEGARQYQSLAHRLRVKLGLVEEAWQAPVTTGDDVSETDFVEDASVATSNAFASQLAHSVASGAGGPGVTRGDRAVELVHVACGREHTLCTGRNGRVYVFGAGAQGRLGNGSEEDATYPTILTSPGIAKEHVVACAAGDAHSLALLKTGEVLSWGFGASGALGHGDTENVPFPKKIQFFVKAGVKLCDIACGAYHSAAVDTDGCVWTWGDGEDGQLGILGQGNPETHRAEVPTKVSLPSREGGVSSRVVALDCSSATTVATTSSGTAFVWGTPELAGIEPATLRERMMLPRAYITEKKLAFVACGGYHAIGLSHAAIPQPPVKDTEEPVNQGGEESRLPDGDVDSPSDEDLPEAESRKPVTTNAEKDDENSSQATEIGKEDDEMAAVELWTDEAWKAHVAHLDVHVGIQKPQPADDSETVPVDQDSLYRTRVYVSGLLDHSQHRAVGLDPADDGMQESVEKLTQRFQSYAGNTVRWEELSRMGLISSSGCSCESCNLSHGVWAHSSAQDAAIREGFWYDDDGSGNALLETRSRAASTSNSNMARAAKCTAPRSSFLPRLVPELSAKPLLQGSSGLGLPWLPCLDGTTVFRHQPHPQGPGRGGFHTAQALSFGDIRVHQASSNRQGLVALVASVATGKRSTPWGSSPGAGGGGQLLLLAGEIPFTSGEPAKRRAPGRHGEAEEQPYAPFTLPVTLWRPVAASGQGQSPPAVQQVCTGGDRLVAIVDGKLHQLKYKHRQDHDYEQQQVLSLKQALQSLEIVAPPHSSVGESIHDALLNSKSFSSVPVQVDSPGHRSARGNETKRHGANDDNVSDSALDSRPKEKQSSQYLEIDVSKDDAMLNVEGNGQRYGTNVTPPAHKRRAKYYLKALKRYSRGKRRRHRLNIRMPLTQSGARTFEFREATYPELLMFRTILRAQNVYHKYSAVHLKPAFFRKLVQQFYGREDELMKNLSEKYGPEPPMLAMEGPVGWARTTPTLLRSPTLHNRVVTQVAAGGRHALALCSKGTVFAWGAAEYGRLGLTLAAGGDLPRPGSSAKEPLGAYGPPGMREGSTFGSESSHDPGLASTTLVVDQPLPVDFTLPAQEKPRYGVLGGGNSPAYQPTIVHVSCGGAHSGAVSSSGELFMWGGGGWGQLGLGRRAHCTVPHRVALPELVQTVLDPDAKPAENPEKWRKQLETKAVTSQPLARKVVCGYSHTVIVTQCGHALSFGRGACGRLGLGDQLDRLMPCWVELKEMKQVEPKLKESKRLVDAKVQVPVAVRVYDAYAGAQHSLFITRSSALTPRK